MNDGLTVVLEDNSPLPMTVGKFNAALAKAASMAVMSERQRILAWIESNRTEVTEGVMRDHFTSEDLVKVLKAGME